MKPTLLILAAGLGQRYGGPKQLDPIGPGGQILLEYSVYDAIRAGFSRVVLVVRPEAEAELRSRFAAGMARRLEIDYAHQRPRDAAAKGDPEARPWGTGAAVLAAAPLLSGPFAVANGDDFYGAESFVTLARFLQAPRPAESGTLAMIGFELEQTLPAAGAVSRALCRVAEDGSLREIVEIERIWRHRGDILYRDPAGRRVRLRRDELVSMNLWAFDPPFLLALRRALDSIRQPVGDAHGSELGLPGVVGDLVANEGTRVEVLTGGGRWCGLTRRSDREPARRFLAELTSRGLYPEDLWS